MASPRGKKYIYFKPLFMIQAVPGEYSQSGDSGSLITNTDVNNVRRAVGIVIGGDDTGVSFALSLDRILQHIDVELVAGHNV